MAGTATNSCNFDANLQKTVSHASSEPRNDEAMVSPSRIALTPFADPYAGYEAWYELSKSLGRNECASALRQVSAAVLATYTTDLLLPLLPVAAASHRLGIEVMEAPFNQIEQSLFDVNRVFRTVPQYIVLAGTWYDLRLLPGESTEAAVQAAVARWTGLWDAAIAAGMRVVQLGFVPPAVDSFGLAASAFDSSITASVARVNAELEKRAASRVLFADAAVAASIFGLRNWNSPRQWYSSRLPCSLDALPHLAALVAGTIAADCGLTARCVITDLDNTLWGGVLGEEGADGIAIGIGPQGEAFTSFQYYLRGLRQRGIALAIASKNDVALVEEVFTRNSRMVLRREDFACIVAGWQPKSEQVKEISQRLHLGLSSLLFVDDNAFERAEVARALPDVQVVEMPRSRAAYPEALASAPGLFSIQCLQTDGLRGQSYEGLLQASELAKQVANLDEFLQSLDMRSELRPVEQTSLQRSAQLLAKTNQFNLTTRRHTQPDLERLMRDPSALVLTLALRDRFADHDGAG